MVKLGISRGILSVCPGILRRRDFPRQHCSWGLQPFPWATKPFSEASCQKRHPPSSRSSPSARAMPNMARKGGNRALAHPMRRPQLEIADRRLQQLHEYWEKERGKRALPSRTDIDPVELRFLLGHLILLDVLNEPRQFRVRLQGTELERWIGGNLTGKTLDQLPSRQLEAVAQECLARAVATKAPYHKIGEQMIDDIPRRFEALVLPLAADGVVINMLLAAVLCRDDRSDV